METLAAWVRPVSGTTAPTQISGIQGSEAAVFTIQLDVSLNAAGSTIIISPGVQLLTGNLMVSDISANKADGASVTISGGSFTIGYSTSTLERAGTMKPTVDISSGTAEVRPTGMPVHIVSTSTVTVNNP